MSTQDTVTRLALNAGLFTLEDSSTSPDSHTMAPFRIKGSEGRVGRREEEAGERKANVAMNHIADVSVTHWGKHPFISRL